jgi:isoaspartyl peptidase/L-asparaginase-like protein (Ntn-hydrolase superfamily)
MLVRHKSQLGIESTGACVTGYGSNLTADGEVECDAAIMDGRTGDFGSVGALSGDSIPAILII